MSQWPRITPMQVATTAIDGLLVITMKQAEDERGVVREFYRESSWVEAGLPSLGPWKQFNVTETRAGAIRGMHGEAMHKLVAVASGEAFGAYVDARRDSTTFGVVDTVELAAGMQVLVPRGVANGFQSLTATQYLYCFDTEWVSGMGGAAVHPLDPAMGIPWPLEVDTGDPAQLSTKDAGQPTFKEATGQAVVAPARVVG